VSDSDSDLTFAQLTTMAVGGPAKRILAATDRQQLIDAALDTWGTGNEWLLLGDGSNVVVGDDGFDGTVIRALTSGIERVQDGGDAASPGTVRLRAQAGESWDHLVAYAVEHGWAGIEALSGIPGSVGAAPVQNIGAYGQELGSSLVAIEFLDHDSGELHRLLASELGLGYRTSTLKQGRRGVVVSVELDLVDSGAGDAAGLSTPIAYAQLASALGVALGDRVPLGNVRAGVLRLRAAKGMLLSSDDPDSVSAGSFFTNPIVSDGFATTLPADAPRWQLEPDTSAAVVVPLASFVPGELTFRREQDEKGAVKLSAAWLIEHSGVARGFSLPGSGAAISTKHTLALVNRGSATASDIAELARYVQSRVLSAYGVILQPEPLLVGLQL
jgi:UDP-N-acetylmuramate dehydrogenase